MPPAFRPSRRQLLLATAGAALVGGSCVGCRALVRPEPPSSPFTPDAEALLARVWADLEPAQVLDVHVHLVGLGQGGSGCEVGPRLQSLLSPGDYLKFQVYLAASGVSDTSRADEQYREQLAGLLRAQVPHGRALLLAFDRAHDDAGHPLPDQSEFYTPNDYVLSLARASPELFVPCASVHPYRADAVAELERVAQAGAVAVKWLPNAMNIDPGSPKCDAFYDALARLGVTLLTHAGEEKAVHADEAQRLGNPLKLRRALSRGVKVIVAHCGSLGSNPDLDTGDAAAPWVDNFDLFARLMDEPQWKGQLFGELSAMAQVNRLSRPLRTTLERTDWHERLVNGSDYPLPAINFLVRTSVLEQEGFITQSERAALNDLYAHDPLLFDFALKRTVQAGGHRFPAQAFVGRPEVFPRLQRA